MTAITAAPTATEIIADDVPPQDVAACGPVADEATHHETSDPAASIVARLDEETVPARLSAHAKPVPEPDAPPAAACTTSASASIVGSATGARGRGRGDARSPRSTWKQRTRPDRVRAHANGTKPDSKIGVASARCSWDATSARINMPASAASVSRGADRRGRGRGIQPSPPRHQTPDARWMQSGAAPPPGSTPNT